MKKFVLTLASSLTLLTSAVLTPALAQTGAPGGGPSNPTVRARIQAMQPVFDLVGRVSLLGEMDAQKGLAVTKAQAKSLLPILRDLQVRTDLKAKDATSILARMEDKILTDKQVMWLDDTQLGRSAGRYEWRAASGRGGWARRDVSGDWGGQTVQSLQRRAHGAAAE